MRPLSLLLLLLALFSESAYGWGKRGHDVVAYIAECHLEESAKARVDELLDGRSMVYYASWMDSASHTPKYSYSRPWHYLNMERDDNVSTVKRSRKGDILSALETLVADMKGGEMSREEESVALKMLIHLLGDMHQPMHLGREEDRGGDTIPVVYFVESVTLHNLWDYNLVMGVHLWSYSEWQEQIDRLNDEEQARVVSGGFAEWIEATHKITNQIYRDTPAEKRVSYDYLDKYAPIVEQQLLYAALRLAHILNDIY